MPRCGPGTCPGRARSISPTPRRPRRGWPAAHGPGPGTPGKGAPGHRARGWRARRGRSRTRRGPAGRPGGRRRAAWWGGGRRAGAGAEGVGVVWRPGGRGGSAGPGPGGGEAGVLVGGGLLAVAGPADHDAEAARVAGDAARRAHDVWRVVVVLDVALGAAVHRLMTRRRQPLDEADPQLEAPVIRSPA